VKKLRKKPQKVGKMAKFKSNLTRLAQMAPQLARDVREQTAEDIADLAQQLAPVLTGELRDSKTVEHEEFISYFGFSAKHAPFVEFGTGEMEAQPFLTPAFLMIRTTFIARMQQALQRLK